MHRFANPNRFLKLSRRLMPWLQRSTLGLIAAGLTLGLFLSPPDYQQGDSVRIMYVHVPAAWMALFCYTAMAGASAAALVWRHALAHVAARATAPIGASFTFIALASGSLWGKPMWGTWWVWDARLTSMLVLFFLYLGYIVLAGAFDDRERAQKSAAVLAIVGFVNVPIIKFSVDWWNTLHQPASVLKIDGPSIDPSMLAPLLLMAIGFATYYFWVLAIRMQDEIMAGKIRALRLRRAESEAGDRSS
ncbi:MAG: heme ABC transporter permease [Rhodospirillales bacterium]|nr:heme ABC transporter permease [Rhodospirillales bacterium]